MARRKESGLDVIAGMPWPFGFVLGIVAYIGIRDGIGWYFSTSGGPFLKGVGQELSGGLYAPIAWTALALCWIAAFVSFMKARQRRTLLDSRTGLESWRAMSWREFEMLAGEAFRRQGYVVEETGLGGADRVLTLCFTKVDARPLCNPSNGAPAKLAYRPCARCGDWPRTMKRIRSRSYARMTTPEMQPSLPPVKPIELLTGQELLAPVRAVQIAAPSIPISQSPPDSYQESMAAPKCSQCAAEMLIRKNRKSEKLFWGWSDFPRCIGSLEISDPEIF